MNEINVRMKGLKYGWLHVEPQHNGCGACGPRQWSARRLA